ncbi:MAG: serine/threonine protein kinase [Planctomycetota bacterium]
MTIDDQETKPIGKKPSAGPFGIAGEEIGHYRLISELGHGGQGYVYLAIDKKLNRKVALKVMLKSAQMSRAGRLRFEREAGAASKLDHPGIARVYEYGEEDGVSFIAFELVQGMNFQDHISMISRTSRGNNDPTEAQETPPNFSKDVAFPATDEDADPNHAPADHQSIAKSCLFVESAARALHEAHEVGLIHRDIKPGNLMVREDGSACVLDFGLAKDDEAQEHTLTQSGDLMGTPAYMSPEQLLAHRVKLDRRTDIYSLGASLFEACTLRRPFEGANHQELYQAIAQQEPQNPRSLNKMIPKDLAAIILTSIDKDRNRRYPTALAFAEDLERFRKNKPVRAKPSGRLIKTIRWSQRNPKVTIMAVGILLSSLSAAGIFYFKNEQNKKTLRAKTQALVERDLG